MYEVSDYTNFPEILMAEENLHPKIHSGILFKRQSYLQKSNWKLNIKSRFGYH